MAFEIQTWRCKCRLANLPEHFASPEISPQMVSTSSAANRAFGAIALLINNYKKFEKSLLKGCHSVEPAQLFPLLPGVCRCGGRKQAQAEGG